jgi:hypothetical protein
LKVSDGLPPLFRGKLGVQFVEFVGQLATVGGVTVHLRRLADQQVFPVLGFLVVDVSEDGGGKEICLTLLIHLRREIAHAPHRPVAEGAHGQQDGQHGAKAHP